MMLICICRWKATVYKQFAGMDWSDAKKMLGSYGPWPKDSPPKLVKQDVASEIPDSFDARRSLRNDDGDGKENGRKSRGFRLAKRARATCFFVDFFAVTPRLRRENTEFHVLRRT